MAQVLKIPGFSQSHVRPASSFSDSSSVPVSGAWLGRGGVEQGRYKRKSQAGKALSGQLSPGTRAALGRGVKRSGLSLLNQHGTKGGSCRSGQGTWHFRLQAGETRQATQPLHRWCQASCLQSRGGDVGIREEGDMYFWVPHTSFPSGFMVFLLLQSCK